MRRAKARIIAIDRGNLHWAVFLSLLTLAVYLLLAADALATNTPMGDVLCIIILFIYGNLGRALAMLGVIVVGIGALLGKTSWGLALTVAVGISVIFGADEIVYQLTGEAGCF